MTGKTLRQEFLDAAGEIEAVYRDTSGPIGYDGRQRVRAAYKTLTDLATHIPGSLPGSPLPYGGMEDKDIAQAVRRAEDGLASPATTLALVREVRSLREELTALGGPYGVTKDTLRSMVAEGFHTAFRKATDSMDAAIAHKAIRDMASDEWSAVLDFTVDPIWNELRRAQAAEEKS